jgi:hypothetical protein
LTTIHIKGKIVFYIFYSFLSTITKHDKKKNNHFILYITTEHNSISIFFYFLSLLSPLSLSLLSRIVTKHCLENIQVCMLMLCYGDKKKTLNVKQNILLSRKLLGIVIKLENTVVLNFSSSR